MQWTTVTNKKVWGPWMNSTFNITMVLNLYRPVVTLLPFKISIDQFCLFRFYDLFEDATV